MILLFLAHDARAADPSWTLTRLDLDVTVVPASRTFRGTGTATLRLDADGSPGPVLGLNTRGPVLRFTSVTPADGVSYEDDGPSRLARVTLPTAASRGDELTLSFAWEGLADSLQLVVTDAVALGSWVEAWYPVPADGAFTGAVASAPGTTTFHLPAGWRSVSNGRLAERVDASSGVTDTWEVTVAVARSFVAGPYEVAEHDVDGRQIGVYLLSPKPVGAVAQAETLAGALSAMEAHFGPYPYPAYAIAEIPEGAVTWYASSEQGFIMATSEAFAVEGGNVPLFAHEAAHGWWGNLVNATGTGALLVSESLAQYGAVTAIEALEGTDARDLFLGFSREGYNPRQCARGYFQIRADGGDKALSRLSDGKYDHNLSDSKGMWVYHMLRLRVGDERFFATLRGLLAEFAGRELSLDDLRAAFVAAAPELDLEAFFAQWLDRTGAPVVDLDWWATEDGVELHLTQRQAGAPFRLPLEVAVETDAGETVFTFALEGRAQTVMVPIDGHPVGVRLDPASKVLLWRPEYGPPTR